jgi:hypothetical protein
MGHPAGWSYCIGEEQDLNRGHHSFHIDMGLPRDASAITLFKAGTHLPMSAAAELLAIKFLASTVAALDPQNQLQRNPFVKKTGNLLYLIQQAGQQCLAQ